MIFKEQLTNISTVLNNTGNTTKLLASFSALDASQQKVLLSSKLLTEEQKEQCIVMSMLSSANTKYTAEQLSKTAGISAETLANWGLTSSTDTLTVSELAEKAATDAQAKSALEKIVTQNAQAVANGELTASNVALTASETGTTLATGAFTTAIKANISAIKTWLFTTPAGWITMLVGGIFLAVKAYDALTVSVEEQKEKMEDSLSAYNDAKSELENITTELDNQKQAMDELLGKEKLTYAEKGQLEELQQITEELRIQKDLAEKEESRTQKEVASDAATLFKKQFGKYDISDEAIDEYQTNANATGNNAILVSNENDLSAMIAGYKQFNDLLDEAYGEKNQEDIDHFTSLTEDLKDSIFSTAQDLQTQQDNMSDYYNTIKNVPYDELTSDQKEVVDAYTAISNAIALIYKELDPNSWNEMQIDKLFTTDGIEKTKDELVEMAKKGTLDESTIQSYSKLNSTLEDSNMILNDGQSAASALCDEMYALADAEDDAQSSKLNEASTSFELPDAETLKQQISDLNSAIDSIQSAYDTLNSAVEEYNTNGGTLSIDTIQSLLSLSDEYLACLQVENGQLSLNADAMAQLAQSKLDDAQATAVTQAMTELQAIANGEAAQSTTNYIAGNAALMSSLAQLSGSYEGVAKAAMTAAQAQKLSALISNAAGKDKTATENVMKGLDTKLKLIQTTKASINAGNFGKVAGKSSSSSKGSGSGKSASDTAKEEIEAYMEYLEKALEGGRITYSDYVRDVTLKLDDMYHNGRITAKEYFDYVEKRLNQQLEVYKSVLSAVTDLLEDEAQKWQDKIDALNDENDLLEKQKDDYDSILSAVDQVYQDEIDRLNEQKDLLQDKIDAINDENDALELQRKKQEALIALDKARQQRNVKIYTEDRGYFYSIDQDAYKDAQQNLQDIKNEEVIKKLEDEQDALDDSIELLEKYRDLWNDIADAYKKKTNEALAVALWGENYEKLILQNRTQDIEAFKDKYLEIQSKIDDNKSLIDSYQEKVDYYNKLKEQWSDISSAYEKEQQRMYAAQILGANWEKDVLDGRLDVLSQFRDQYLEIQRQMTQAALDGARARNDAAASGGTGGSGGSSGGGGGSTPIQNQQAYHVLHLVGGYSTSGEASSKISSFNGKGVYKYKDGKWYVYKEEDYSNLSFGSKSEADDYIKKHLSPAGKFLVKYYHNGLENGLVDFSKKDSNFDLVQKYGLKKYEVPAILKQGEAVMNQEQIKNLGEALRAIPTAATLYTTPDYTKMLSSLKTNNTPIMVTQSVNITLPNVTNNSGYENLTRELNRLKLDAYQFANRRN